MSANKVFLRNSAGTDPVILENDKITTTVLPECSATVSSANQLVNKTYADTKVSKSGAETRPPLSARGDNRCVNLMSRHK